MNAANFTTTSRKHSESIICQFMTTQGLERMIFFRVKGYSDAQRNLLCRLLADGLITTIQLPKARRQFFLVRPRHDRNDLQELNRIQNYLTVAFGPKCRIRVSVVWRCLSN